jgi:hypothetical protein
MSKLKAFGPRYSRSLNPRALQPLDQTVLQANPELLYAQAFKARAYKLNIFHEAGQASHLGLLIFVPVKEQHAFIHKLRI